MKTEYKPIPRFNDHGATCKGHQNHMLDCEYTTKEDRDNLARVIDKYLENWTEIQKWKTHLQKPLKQSCGSCAKNLLAKNTAMFVISAALEI